MACPQSRNSARDRQRKQDASIPELAREELARSYLQEDIAARTAALSPPRAALAAQQRALARVMEQPNIPRVELLELEDRDGGPSRLPARGGGEPQQIGALTARLNKLQNYLAAEKQA